MRPNGGSSAHTTVARVAAVVTGVAVAVVFVGGTAAWWVERGAPGGGFRSWGDGLWWALTTLTTVGYGDHVPVTLAGRLIAAAVMIAGVAVLGGVAAGVALVVARTVAVAEEQALEAEAESLESRLELRLDSIDARLARVEERLRPRGRGRQRIGEEGAGGPFDGAATGARPCPGTAARPTLAGTESEEEPCARSRPVAGGGIPPCAGWPRSSPPAS